METQQERREFLITSLLQENPQFQDIKVPEDAGEQRQLLRALMNVRTPKECPPLFWQIQDAYLAEETKEKGITRLEDLPEVQPGIYLWQGDITTLACDAIVNAANSGMTGCYVPNHRCIDNCIHTYAGMQLRLDCARMMQRQGFPEPTGNCWLPATAPVWNLLPRIPWKVLLFAASPPAGFIFPMRKQLKLL